MKKTTIIAITSTIIFTLLASFYPFWFFDQIYELQHPSLITKGIVCVTAEGINGTPKERIEVIPPKYGLTCNYTFFNIATIILILLFAIMIISYAISFFRLLREKKQKTI